MTEQKKRSVLVAVEFDEQSQEASRQAHLWARDLDADLIACHAVRPALDELLDLEDARQAVTKRIHELTGKSIARVTTVFGTPEAAILRAADGCGAELIVLGGERTSSDALFGPALRGRVARLARCSVAIARASGTGPIVVGTDFSPESEDAVAFAADMARRRDKGLVVVHSAHVPISTLGKLRDLIDSKAAAQLQERRMRNAKATMAELVESLDGDVTRMVVAAKATDALVEAARKHDASAVVVAATGRTSYERARIGIVPETLIYRDCPTLVIVRPPNSKKS